MTKRKGDTRHTRGTSNHGKNGSSYDRRARKLWLLKSWDADLGTDRCRCVDCGITLTFASLQVDRVVPGALGGRYTRDNIQPMCGPCNLSDGARLRTWLRHLAALEVTPSAEQWLAYKATGEIKVAW